MSEVDETDWADLLDLPVRFVSVPNPISPQFRPRRRVSLCLLLIDKGWGGRLNWRSLHVLSWAVQSPERVALLGPAGAQQIQLEKPIVRFEPALDRAIDLAVGFGLVVRANSSFELTAEGENVLERVRDSGALRREEEILSLLKRKVSAKAVDRLLEWRTK